MSQPCLRGQWIVSEARRLLHPTAEIDLAGTTFGEVERVRVAAVDISGIVGGDAFKDTEFFSFRCQSVA
jgi:hypothetical protein